MIADEPFEFRVYKATQGISYRMLPEFDPDLPNQGSFAHFGMSGIIGFKLGSTSVSEYDEPGLRIYPNPSQGIFTIEQDAETHYDRYEIIEVSGRKILSDNLQTKTEVDLSSFEKGIYFIKLSGLQKTDLQKIVLR